MEILKCNADYNKIYYVEIEGSLYQCRLMRTESRAFVPMYVLDVAQLGLVRIPVKRLLHFDRWWRDSTIPSILYESAEDYRNGKPITDEYGSTSNCYNIPFVCPLFKCVSTCNCGGSVITWRWNGCKAIQHIVKTQDIAWHWDSKGFHCILNDLKDCYRTKEECEKCNTVNVVTF